MRADSRQQVELNMIPDRSIPRPTFADVFADESFPGVDIWINNLAGKIDAYTLQKFKEGLPDGDRNLRDLLRALANGAKSPLAMIHNLQNTLDWPVDDDLYTILKSAVTIVEASALRRRTTEWVMKTGTRFNPKVGDRVTFFDVNMNAHRGGTVRTIDKPIATAIVEVGDVKVAVEAERVA